MASARVLIRDPRAVLAWSVARSAALLAVPILVTWLVLDPARALKFLWYIAIPILPATFFISTKLWRGICPLATLNEFGNRLGTPRTLAPRTGLWLSVAGLLLFHLLVPGRRFVFNQNGPALAVVIIAVGALAVILGSRFSVRSGFCNSLCPVLPVELLYGQAPLVRLDRARCTSCTVCTPRGCLDLAEAKALPQMLGGARRTAGWLATPYGAFFAGLPGFIVGYNRLTDGPLGTVLNVYGTTLGFSVASYLAIGLVVVGLGLKSEPALALVGGLAGAVYYWYSGPAIATQLGGSPWVGVAIRGMGIGLVGWWLARTLRRNPAGPQSSGLSAGFR